MATTTKPIILDETGQAIRDAIVQVAVAIRNKDEVVYGFRIDPDESDPDSMVTYLRDAVGMTPAKMDYDTGEFDYGSWEDAFFMPKPCMLKQDGTVDYYLDPTDYAKKEDGTASDIADTTYSGNAMMEWGQNGKKIWIKRVPDSTGYGVSVYIANSQIDEDYHDWNFHNSQSKSVDHFYTPIYNGSLIDSTLRSMSGQTVMKSQTAANERTYAQANNPADTDPMYDIECKADIDLINDLLTLMAKTTDHQTAYGKGLCDGGNESINNGFSTGVHNAKGLFYGTNSGTASTYTNAVKVFGMENWYGFQWRRYIGHIMVNGVQKVKLTYGQEDGSTADGYNLTGADYTTENSTAPSGTNGGYQSKIKYTEKGAFMAVVSGSASTYYCDGAWYNNAITAVPCRGGASGAGARVGSFFAHLSGVASHSDWSVGAALSCKPLA